MRVLVLCDDYWHPGRIPRGGLEMLGDPAFEFEFIEDATGWSPEKLKDYSLVVLSKSNDVTAAQRGVPWVTPEVEEAFVDFVQRGGGLLATHSGTVYRDKPVMRGLLGGAFINHPKQCPVTHHFVAGHPLAAGCSDFTLTDEHYQMELDDSQADVYMTTASEHSVMPGGWTRSVGQGRVCVLTPSHNLEVWQHPSFQAALRNALRWCAKLA